MRTIKSYIIIILLLLSIASCKKAEEMVFSNEANVYFDIYNGDKDSLVRTFAYTPTKAQDTLLLPVRLSGIRTSVARTYNVRVESDSSTAIPEQHYQPLKSTYTMPKRTRVRPIFRSSCTTRIRFWKKNRFLSLSS
ncbi:DUF4843 domain-containing protein [Pedobacter panaciterrae]